MAERSIHFPGAGPGGHYDACCYAEHAAAGGLYDPQDEREHGGCRPPRTRKDARRGRERPQTDAAPGSGMMAAIETIGI